MDAARHTAREIIEAFGGASAFARSLGIEHRRSAVANWAKDGIPARYWPAISRAADGTDAAWVTLDVLEQHTAPRREEAA